MGITAARSKELNRDFQKILQVLEDCPEVDKDLSVPPT